MRLIRRLLLLLLTGPVLGVVPAGAQTVSSPYRYIDEAQSLSVFGGYLRANAGELELGPESSPAGGLRYTIRLSGPFTVEGSATLVPTTREVFDTVAVDAPLEHIGEASLTLLNLLVGLRFNITGPRTWHGFQPYLLAGGGLAAELSGTDEVEVTLPPDSRFDFGTRFAGQIGAGVEWFATRRLSLVVDARDVFWKLKTPPAIRRQSTAIAEDEWVQNFLFSLGAAFHF